MEYNVNEDYYLCKKCSTHISLQSQLLKKYHPAENNKNYLVLLSCSSINVVGDEYYMISNKKTTVRSYYCTTCNANLGFKFIILREPKDEIQEGRFILFTDKLMLWKGQELHNAVTEEPVGKIPGGVVEEPADGDNNQQADGVTDELVENKLLDEVTEEPTEKIMAGHLKLFLGVPEEQVENKSLVGMTDDLGEKRLAEELFEKNLHGGEGTGESGGIKSIDEVTEEPLETITGHLKQLLRVTEEQVENKSLDGVTDELSEKKLHAEELFEKNLHGGEGTGESGGIKLIDEVTEEPLETITGHLKQLLRVTEEQVENKSLDGVTDELGEKKLHAEELVEKNLHGGEGSGEPGGMELLDKVTQEPVEEESSGEVSGEPADQN